MDNKNLVRLSKFLSFVLRHEPESIGLTLDPQGWAPIDRLIELANAQGKALSRPLIEEIVQNNSKQRFAISEDGLRIRANQGHSTEVELGYEPQEPPALLFHGTTAAALPAIRAEGLLKMARHHVHLSAEQETARNVGGRRGAPVVLVVDAARMHRDGHRFYVSANGVWLTERVPPEYLAQ